MRSRLPKVLHPIGRLPMIAHVLKALRAAGGRAHRRRGRAGPRRGGEGGRRRMRPAPPCTSRRSGAAPRMPCSRRAPRSQARRRRRARRLRRHAVRLARQRCALMRGMLADGAAIVVGGMRPADPTRLRPAGRWRTASSSPSARSGTRARRSATSASCNGGIMALAGATALDILDAIGDDNAQREFYLTDAVEIANRRGLKVGGGRDRAPTRCSASTTARSSPRRSGMFQARRRAAAMADGATLIAPETVFFAHDTELGRDVSIEPNVVFGPGVTVADDVDHPRLQPYRGRAHRRRRDRRPVRAAAARRGDRRGRPYRQFRRDQAGRRGARAPRSTTSPISATRASARRPISAPARSPAITTASPSTAPRSASAPSSAPTPRWSRR